MQASRGFEPRSLDSESSVLTVTPRGQVRAGASNLVLRSAEYQPVQKRSWLAFVGGMPAMARWALITQGARASWPMHAAQIMSWWRFAAHALCGCRNKRAAVSLPP